MTGEDGGVGVGDHSGSDTVLKLRPSRSLDLNMMKISLMFVSWAVVILLVMLLLLIFALFPPLPSG